MDSFAIKFPANGFDTLRAWVYAYDKNQVLIMNTRLNVTQNNSLSVPLQFITCNVNIDDNKNQYLKQKRLELYPNPAQDNITIKFEHQIPGIAFLKVYDIGGKVVLEQNLGRLGIGTFEFQTEDLALSNGSYMIGLITDQCILINTFIIYKP